MPKTGQGADRQKERQTGGQTNPTLGLNTKSNCAAHKEEEQRKSCLKRENKECIYRGETEEISRWW